MRISTLAPALLLLPSLAACDGAPATDKAFDGPGVTVDVAALNLVGVGDVVWDIEVVNGRTPTPDVVWQRRLTSSGYGDGAGSASYIGPCDADSAVADNVVRVWVVGLYTGAVASGDAGQFNSGAATGIGTVTGTEVDFRNPTDDGPLTQTVTCRDNADVAVQFDVSLMRPAQQGFFDVAVNFNDIFCSAKFDCCNDTGATCDDITLLFDENGARARTFVLGFACTAGTGAGVTTELYLDRLALDCTTPGTGTFEADILVSPGGDAGNQCTPGSLSGCAAISEPGGLDADAYLFQAGVYRGAESLTSGGPANKVYWNIALGVRAPISGCHLRTTATADNGAVATDNVDGGTIAAGAVYPVISWDVDLATCQAEELDDSAMVESGYTSVDGAGTTFDYAWAAGAPPVRTCPPGWLLIGDTCVEDVDHITNGTFDTGLAGWTGSLGSWNADGTVSVSTSTVSTNYFRQTVTTIPGVTYVLTFDVVALSGPGGISSNVYATNDTEDPRNGVKLAASTSTTTPSSGRTYTFTAETAATNIVIATEVQIGNTTHDNVTLFIAP